MEHYFAPCPRGLSGVLADELTALGATTAHAQEAGVAFDGDKALGYLANLHSRMASRVLQRVAHFPYANEQQIYDAAAMLAWPSWFDVSRTIKVEINAHRCPLKSLDFITLRVKDAVCDKFREQVDLRPSVDARDPDIRIHVFLDATHASLYLDLSGEPLFKRGVRDHTGEAPLKKNLAAGIIKLSGWQPGEAFLDPMCGSGTFLIEAAEMALDIAPGLSGGKLREFAFTKLKSYDKAMWDAQVAKARARIKPGTLLPIYGTDKYGYAITDARENLTANGLIDFVHLKQVSILEVAAPAASGVLVTNPPYGERLGDTTDLAELYPQLGDWMKQKFAGWRAYFFTGDPQLAKGVRLSASKRTPLFNGKIECRLFEYKIIAGSNRKPA
ncbi:MAG: THUMP domain-containing protein [Burkholderiales bacterium]|nr:THUMP domain-containing protein [Burkholderiales bacterium]